MSLGLSEFRQHLPARAARGAGGLIQVGDRDGLNTDVWTTLCHGAHESGALRTYGEAVAHILHVCPGDNLSAGEAQCRSHLEAGVGGVGTLRGLPGVLEESRVIR